MSVRLLKLINFKHVLRCEISLCTSISHIKWVTRNKLNNTKRFHSTNCSSNSTDCPQNVVPTVTAKPSIAAMDVSSTTAQGSGTGEGSTISPVIERIKRQEPGKVIFGFVPVEWRQAFYHKTGATGLYTFLVTYSTFLMSKEIFVMEHEYYSGLSMLVVVVVGAKYLGKTLADSLDKEIDDYEAMFTKAREAEIEMLNDNVEHEKLLQASSEGQLMLLDAKRENVTLQLEANYRERLMQVYLDTKNRLDFQVALEESNRKFQHLNLVDWVTTEVHKNFTQDKQDAYLEQCIDDLAKMAQLKATVE